MLASVAKIAFCLGFFVFGLTPLLVILERRISAWMQGRIGPNRVDTIIIGRLGGLLPRGLGHPLADAVKLIFKEDILPEKADKWLYWAAPMIVIVPPALGLIVIPFGSRIGAEQLQVADLGIGVLWTMSVLSVAVYGLAFGGWASNNKYSLLGGLRSSAQLISYELSLGLSILTVLMLTAAHPAYDGGTVLPHEIVRRQVEHGWNILGGGNYWLAPFALLSFVLFYTSALAENNRLPFDLPECEAELVGGYHTEYSGLKFAMFMMGEYVGMTLMSALMVTFFFGGWSLPSPFGLLGGANAWLDGGAWYQGAASVGIFVGKTMVLLLLYIALRWTLPRFKYNQLMDLGWKRLVPIGLANLAAIAVVGILTAGGAK
ncbi:MAG TPA: complex I subunit 1 family protein [Planctomycetota bacterium]|nr:complex I subunit 1 family protein [Planctomycetota bacterium]